MDIDKNEEIFQGKTFQGLMKDIYENSRKKEAQINELIKQLQPMIKNMGDATILKNDEHLIKMAAIVQRAMGKGEDSTGGVLLTEAEKRQLLEAVEESQDRG